MKSAYAIMATEQWVRSGMAAQAAREIVVALLILVVLVVWMVARDIRNERKEMDLD